ncbi:MAG: cation/acetate symporter [Planctomycetota bacterium]|jgi:cation/acetate symporter
MSIQNWTFLLVGLSFALYIGLAFAAKAKSTSDFYVAGGHVSPFANGLATAADWMSAASFISMAGLISTSGYDGSVYLMGWTGGYVLLALLLAPYLRKFGKFTVPDFVGDRYESQFARYVAVFCAIFVSFTYVAGQMRGVGIVFSRFLEVDIEIGVMIGMAIVFFYAVLGGMKGITYTQVAQYCVLIFAYMVPAIFLSVLMTGNPVPQLGFSANAIGTTTSLLDKLDGLHTELGFASYTLGSIGKLDMFCITAALMAGTAGLPHVIVRFYTVPSVRDARRSVGWALIFIAVLYTAAPAVAVFARTNLLETVAGKPYEEMPAWFSNWERTSLISFEDHNADGKIQFVGGAAVDVEGMPIQNELFVDKDILVLANPEIAGLPNWVVALVAAGGLAAALSTAAGLLLVVSSAISHDLLKRGIRPDISERAELIAARVSAAVAVGIAGYLGINPPGLVGETVAFAFGLAASSFFPAIILGIFDKRMNRAGAVTGMVLGIFFTATYIVWFRFMHPELDLAENWLFGISPKGIGTVGMCLNFIVALILSRMTSPPSERVRQLVERIRVPR